MFRAFSRPTRSYLAVVIVVVIPSLTSGWPSQQGTHVRHREQPHEAGNQSETTRVNRLMRPTELPQNKTFIYIVTPDILNIWMYSMYLYVLVNCHKCEGFIAYTQLQVKRQTNSDVCLWDFGVYLCHSLKLPTPRRLCFQPSPFVCLLTWQED